MKKIIIAVSFMFVLAGAFLFWNSRINVIADDKDGKCCNTECPKYADCTKKCDKTCDSLKTECKMQCEKSCDKKQEDCKKKCCANPEGQSQMNNCPKTNCQPKTECSNKDAMKNTGKCPHSKQQQNQ